MAQMRFKWNHVGSSTEQELSGRSLLVRFRKESSGNLEASSTIWEEFSGDYEGIV